MQRNLILIVFAPLFYILMISSIVHCTTVTTCSFDKQFYYPGQTGYVTVTLFNDKDSVIRIYELAATIDYYYNDDNVYLQTFFTNPDPPIAIQQGQSDTFSIDFSLPTNIAPGYTTLLVKAKTEMWNDEAQRWQESDHPTYRPTLFIESPYKQQLEDQQATNQQLKAINQQTTAAMYVLGATALVFAIVIVVLLIFLRSARAKFLAQSAA